MSATIGAVLVGLSAATVAFCVLWLGEWRARRWLERAHRRERRVWQKQLVAVARTIATGSPDTFTPQIVPQPDAEERIHSAISAETLARGVARLTEAYEAAGLRVDPDVIRAEAEAMLYGQVPKVSHTLAVLDGPDALRD